MKNLLVLTKLLLLACLLFTTTNLLAQPPNPTRCTAQSVTCGDIVIGSTIGGGLDGAPTCGVSQNAEGVWYTFDGTGYNVTFSLCGSATYDTRISAWHSPSCSGTLNCVAGNENFCGNRSQISFTSIYGYRYWILVHGNGVVGNFELAVTCAPPPNNDVCAATAVNCGSNIIGTTTNATNDVVPSCSGLSNTSNAVWFTYPGDGSEVTASLCTGTTYDSQLSVYEAASCSGTLNCIEGSNDFCGDDAEVTFVSTVGTDYYIMVNGFGSAAGSYTLDIRCAEANDSTCTATPLYCGSSVNGKNDYAQSDAIPACAGIGSTATGVWYSFTGTGDSILVDVSSSIGAWPLVFTAPTCTAPLSCVAAADTATSTSVGFNTSFGTEYYIFVKRSGTAGNFNISLTCNPSIAPPINDDICNAIPMVVSNSGYIFRSDSILNCYTRSGTNVNATSEISEPASSCISSANTVWHTFTAPACNVSGFMPFDLSLSTTNPGTTFDTEITLYESSDGSCTGTLTEVLCADDGIDYSCTSGGPAMGSNILAAGGTLTPGATYFIKVAHNSNTTAITGNYELSLNVRPAAPTLVAGPQAETDIDVSWPPHGADNVDIFFSPEGYSGYGVRWNRTGVTEPLRYLTPGTRYEVWLREECITSGVEYFMSPLDTLTTASSVCSAPDPLSCGTTTPNSITINWTNVPPALYYHVYYRPVGSSGYNIRWRRTGTSYTLTGLTPGTAYQIWVYAVCGPGFSYKSLDLFCSTASPGAIARYSEEEQTASFTFDGTEFVNYPISQLPLPSLENMKGAYYDWSSGELRVYDEFGNEVAPFDYSSAVSNEFTFSVIPNVTTAATKVGLFIDNTEEVTIQLYDVQGNLLQSHDLGERNGSITYELNTSQLPAGMYHVNVRTSSNFATQKLVVVQ